MTDQLAAVTESPEATSYLKQKVLERYVAGEISLVDMTERFSQIAPPTQSQSWKVSVAAGLFSIIVAALTPPWARRDDS